MAKYSRLILQLKDKKTTTYFNLKGHISCVITFFKRNLYRSGKCIKTRKKADKITSTKKLKVKASPCLKSLFSSVSSFWPLPWPRNLRIVILASKNGRTMKKLPNITWGKSASWWDLWVYVINIDTDVNRDTV